MTSWRTWLVVLALALAGPGVPGGPAAAQTSKHEGYYYPRLNSKETYTSRARTLADTNRGRRVGFVSGVTKILSEQPYPAAYAIFAKGDEAEKLIIVAYGEGMLNTIYRARALFATLTSYARLSPIFQEYGVEDWFTFFDLAKMLGFEQITISDGSRFAHQVKIQ